MHGNLTYIHAYKINSLFQNNGWRRFADSIDGYRELSIGPGYLITYMYVMDRPGPHDV